MSLLTIQNVDFQYPTSQELSLKNINLNLDQNSINVIVGPSGIGKTTLLNLIAGYDFPTVGKITMTGQPITGANWQRGMVFQDMALFGWLNVDGNILFGPKMRKMNLQLAKDRLKKLLFETGLAEYRRTPVYELSGGLKQRVALARAFINEPPLLMLDESFSALDNATRNDMHDTLIKMWRNVQNCVLAITHDIDEAIFLGQKIIVINQRPGTIIDVIDNPYFMMKAETLPRDNQYFSFRRHLMALIVMA